ncbi:MAG: aminopeptidase, partial [Methylococcales bacterium]|nr:aminopeptidase [Methylococcales bacterium]
LGWLADPVLSTMLARSEAAMAGLIFHELAHQQLYVKGDTKFNESFASAVEAIGLRQWADAQTKTAEIDSYFAEKAKTAAVIKLLLAARERMQAAYLRQSDEQVLAQIKQAQFALLKQEYQALKLRGGGTEGFDRFFDSDLNHASLALFGEYHGWVHAFERLFELNDRHWEAFYEAAEAIGDIPQESREAQLAKLQG